MINIQIYQQIVHHIKIYSPREESDELTFLNFLKDILTHKQFAIILEVEGEKTFSPNAKKELASWFKKNKKLLSDKCLGLARISTEASKMHRFKSRALSLAMPCAYGVFTDSNSARKWLSKKL